MPDRARTIAPRVRAYQLARTYDTRSSVALRCALDFSTAPSRQDLVPDRSATKPQISARPPERGVTSGLRNVATSVEATEGCLDAATDSGSARSRPIDRCCHVVTPLTAPRAIILLVSRAYRFKLTVTVDEDHEAYGDP